MRQHHASLRGKQFAVASNEGRRPVRLRRCVSQTVDAVEAHRLEQSLELDEPEVGSSDMCAYQPMSRLADGDRPGGRRGLYPRSDVDGVAEHRCVRPDGLAQRTNDGQPGVDADAGTDAHGRVSGAHAIETGEQIEPRSDCPDCVVLIGHRVAEQTEHAVAEVHGHMTAGCRDRGPPGLLVGEHRLGVGVEVDLLRKDGGTDEISEQRCDLASLAGHRGARHPYCASGRRSTGGSAGRAAFRAELPRRRNDGAAGGAARHLS